MFNALLGKDVLICDDVSWWIKFNKGVDSIYDIAIGILNIVESMRTNNQVAQAHSDTIGSSIVSVDGGKIPQAMSFSLTR